MKTGLGTGEINRDVVRKETLALQLVWSFRASQIGGGAAPWIWAVLRKGLVYSLVRQLPSGKPISSQEISIRVLKGRIRVCPSTHKHILRGKS